MTTFADQSLEGHIAQWREYQRRRQALHRSDLEELGGHLRDQRAALIDAVWRQTKPSSWRSNA